MGKSTTPTVAPSFVSVAIDSLPAGVKSASPETLALGRAILAAMDGGKAAQDPTTYADRADAVKRAAVLKRAVKAAGGPVAATRVYAVDGSFRVAIFAKPESAEAETAESAETETAESAESAE